MKSLIRWAIRNTPAMNTLMVGVLVVGAVSLTSMHREVFPEFELEIILVSVPYPGASPEEVEEGICQKIEESVRSVEGIKKQNAVAREGIGTVILELEADVPDVQKILNEIRSEIDRIPSFPELAEDPEVKQITLRRSAIRVGVIGPDTSQPGAERELRDLAERIRDELLLLEPVSQANLVGAKPYQIDIEISENTLREYGLTLQQVARIVRRENLEMPGGSMKTDAQEMLLRGKNKRLVGEQIAQIPLVTRPGGVVLTVGDLGRVRDEFDDSTAVSRINGKPALEISVDKTAGEDLLAITDEVKRFVDEKQERMPPGYSLVTWADESVNVRDRMALLGKNGLQGLVLVLIVLALFLEPRLAFWVALGIPISILGACGVMLYAGQTMNMLSMFAFLMALGILVDDAIVIGENIYAHRQRGSDYIRAAVEGTYEVLPSVLASVATTIIAFAPMLFVPGIMGKFFGVIPFAVIAMLVISLMESAFILPCHLAHVPRSESVAPASGGAGDTWNERLPRRIYRFYRALPAVARWTYGGLLPLVAGIAWAVDFLFSRLFYPVGRLGSLLGWVNRWSDRHVRTVISRFYLPLLRWSLDNPATVVSTAATVLLLTAGFYRGGFIPFQLFPRLDANTIQATVTFPDGTPAAITDEATRRLQRAIQEINDEYAGDETQLATLIQRTVGIAGESATMSGNPPTSGSHMGRVRVELVEGSHRSMKSQDIVMQWRERAGEFAGVESLTFGSVGHGPGGAAVEFKLLGDRRHMAVLEEAVDRCKAKLGEYQGTLDIEDDSRPGKWEFQLTVKDSAQAMGVPLADLAGTVRAAYYGEEVMRLQRGRHEVKLMVRYPPDERRSLAAFDDLRVRTGGGAERPLTELAQLNVRRGYSTINRLDQRRAITITADVDESIANADEIVTDLRERFVPQLLAKPEFAGLNVRWEGQQEQSSESMGGLFRGLLIAMVAMFAILTLEFRSYIQPLLILLIIPFGAVGAIVGHVVMGMSLSLFSVFGMVALSGVVVNDSIVLIDFINRRVRSHVPLKTALLDAGSHRFRPVALTSLTTIAGLLPILLETSFQAQFLIPMATSLSFGLLFATLLVLILVPTWYLIYFRLTRREPSPLEPEPVADVFDQTSDVELQEPAQDPWAADSTPVGRE